MILSEKDPLYRQCAISLMDNIADPTITFDDKGISNYYYDYKKEEANQTLIGVDAQKKIDEIIHTIKKDGVGKKYDCIIGVSGGIDSTYLCYKAKEYGLRVLCVHFDNGWNSQDAVNNIENILKKLDFVHYQNTGCEDSIGNDYDYKKKTIINFINKVKFYFTQKENFESDKDLEILKDKVMVEVCSKIVNVILLESKE